MSGESTPSQGLLEQQPSLPKSTWLLWAVTCCSLTGLSSLHQNIFLYTSAAVASSCGYRPELWRPSVMILVLQLHEVEPGFHMPAFEAVCDPELQITPAVWWQDLTVQSALLPQPSKFQNWDYGHELCPLPTIAFYQVHELRSHQVQCLRFLSTAEKLSSHLTWAWVLMSASFPQEGLAGSGWVTLGSSGLVFFHVLVLLKLLNRVCTLDLCRILTPKMLKCFSIKTAPGCLRILPCDLLHNWSFLKFRRQYPLSYISALGYLSTVTPRVRRARCADGAEAQPPDSWLLCGFRLLGIGLIMLHDTLAPSVTGYSTLHFSGPYVDSELPGWYLGYFL